MTTTEASLDVDILPFVVPSPVPTDRRVLMSITPETIAQIAAAGLGLDICDSASGPRSLWAETVISAVAAKATAKV